MRNFIEGISNAINQDTITFFFLLELQFGSLFRFCDGDFPIIHEGEKFTPIGFKFGDISGSSLMAVESLDIEIDDTNKYLISNILTADIRNKWCILYFGVMDNTKQVYVQEFLRGIVGAWEAYDDNIIKITITNELVLWNKKPLRIQMTSCPWTFKGQECGYAGAENWCDQSYERCKDLLNTDYFGGERFLSSLMGKELWWGRTRKL